MSSGSETLPDLDMDGIRAEWEDRVAEAAPDLLPLALRTLERVGPQRWTLEWYLPWWLGHALRLAPDVSRSVVLSNVLGLASVRLQDDLVDGDVEADAIPSVERLGSLLEREAVSQYRPLFDGSSSFWPRMDAYLAEWRSATVEAGPQAGAPSSSATMTASEVAAALSGAEANDRLARRGAPLRISAFAVCLLSGREDRFQMVDRCLDHALTAMVLYDHFVDWQRDLAAGRWNVFVAEHGGERASVLMAMLTDRAVERHFARIHAETMEAATVADELGSRPLAAHLRGYAVQIGQQGALLESHHGHLADQATALMFGAVASGPAP